MGIGINALSIFTGCLIGSSMKSEAPVKNLSVLGICIMIISFVGFTESIFIVNPQGFESKSLMIVVFSLLAGNAAGEKLKLSDRLSNLSSGTNGAYNAFVDSVVFFGVGGLQICGPILLGINNDSSQLILKAFVDFPFAVLFGATYGRVTALSAFPVAILQAFTALLARGWISLFSDALVDALCAMGYIILFFSGFNLVCDVKYKIRNINMLPGIFIVVLMILISDVTGGWFI